MATQTEWTLESVMEMGVIGNVSQDIADAHNAALAEGVKVLAERSFEFHECQKQLAAAARTIHQLREQVQVLLEEK